MLSAPVLVFHQWRGTPKRAHTLCQCLLVFPYTSSMQSVRGFSSGSDLCRDKQLQKMSRDCLHPDCQRAMNSQEEYDASERAALVAVSLISSARVILGLDSECTSYSAQYLVDYAGTKKESGQGETAQQRSTLTIQDLLEYLVEIASPKTETEQREMDERRQVLTVKDCLEYALKEGIPKSEHWTHLGCVHKPPPFASRIPRVPMKGVVVEAKTLDEGFKLLKKQTVGAKLHVFSPEIDLVGEDGVYEGPSGPGTRYVGLRDVVITGVGKINGDAFAEVQICYKKKTSFVKVSTGRMLTSLPHDGDESQVIEPTGLLVDFIVPRLSK